MLMKPIVPSHPALLPAAPRLRRAVAASLHAASRLLHGLAQRLAATPAPRVPASVAVLEFHAEAGAPEGALYVDGQLVAHLAGITRL